MQTIWLAFLTGLTTGGISCLAVQGGLLASSVSQSGDIPDSRYRRSVPARPAGGDSGNQVDERRVGYRAVGMFLLAKFAGYVTLGFLLGAIGSTLLLSPKFMGLVQIFAGLFMLATAARIAELHPIFRYALIQPPRWAYKFLRRISHDESSFAPAALGFFTILMPCGVTQATMAVAVASGSPWLGAAIMGAFVLGTSPIFFFLGAAVMTLLARKTFAYAAACVVAIFAILSVNGGIGLTGSFFTFANIYRAATINLDQLAYAKVGTVAGVAGDGMQQVTIRVRSDGYTSDTPTIRAGVPVNLRLITEEAKGCTRAFTIPNLGISKVLPVSGEEDIVFTPQKTGQLAYSCSMGMYTGQFQVIP